MSDITFCTDNLIDNAQLSITTGTANAQFPLTNIQHDFTTKVFRSTGNTATILIDTGVSSPVDTLALVGSSNTGLGIDSLVLKGSPTTDFSGSTPHIITLNSEYNMGFGSFIQESHRYWQLEITGATFCELSNIYIGAKTTITTNGLSTKSFTYTNKDNSSIKKNKYGQRFIDTFNSIKSIQGKMGLVNATEFDTLQHIFSNHKKIKPIFFMLDPNDNMPETDSRYLYSGLFYFDRDFTYKMIAPGLYDVLINLGEGK